MVYVVLDPGTTTVDASACTVTAAFGGSIVGFAGAGDSSIVTETVVCELSESVTVCTTVVGEAASASPPSTATTEYEGTPGRGNAVDRIVRSAVAIRTERSVEGIVRRDASVGSWGEDVAACVE